MRQVLQAIENGARVALLSGCNGRIYTARLIGKGGSISDNLHLIAEEIPFGWTDTKTAASDLKNLGIEINIFALSTWEIIG